jgi:hypothetical protein
VEAISTWQRPFCCFVLFSVSFFPYRIGFPKILFEWISNEKNHTMDSS